VSSATCAECGAYLESADLRHPGYCSPPCRDRARAKRDAVLNAGRLLRRAIAADRAATRRRPPP
jgi:hypothetical protein